MTTTFIDVHEPNETENLEAYPHQGHAATPHKPLPLPLYEQREEHGEM